MMKTPPRELHADIGEEHRFNFNHLSPRSGAILLARGTQGPAALAEAK